MFYYLPSCLQQQHCIISLIGPGGRHKVVEVRDTGGHHVAVTAARVATLLDEVGSVRGADGLEAAGEGVELEKKVISRVNRHFLGSLVPS